MWDATEDRECRGTPEMRPPESLLNHFSDLAEYDDAKRHQAVIGIIKGFEVNEEYCMNRLISGLASSRAAARLGFSCALTLILSSAPEKWSSDRLFELIDENLDIRKADSLPSVIGQHLAFTSMINSNNFKSTAKELVSRELILLEKHRSLGMAICDSIARLALQLDESKFSKSVWPQIKKYVAEPFSTLLPEWMYFSFLVAEKFSNVMSNQVSFINPGEGLSLKRIDAEGFRNVLKKAKGNDSVILGLKLLCAAQITEQFDKAYENFIVPWLQHGDIQKALDRTLRFNNSLLSDLKLSPSEILSVFSPRFLQTLCSVRKEKEHRYATPLTVNVLDKLIKSIDEDVWSRNDLLTLLERLDSVEGGNFDNLFSVELSVTEKAMSKLDTKGAEKYISKGLASEGWPLKRIAKVFSSWPVDLQEKALIKFARREPRTEEVHYAFCDCIGSLFTTKVRAGRSVKCEFPEHSEQLLKNVLSINSAGVEMPVLNNRALFALYLLSRLWAASTSDEQEKLAYLKDSEEILFLDKELLAAESEASYSVIIDLLLSVLSRPRRFHRSVIHYVFATLVPRFKFANIEHIFETINVPDDELMKMKENESDSDREELDIASSDEEGKYSGEKGEDEDEGKETDEEADLDGEADPQLLQDLKAVFSETGVNGDSGNNESISSDLSDDTMFRLDEGLAEVFRKQKKRSYRTDTNIVAQSQQFRLKCFDLLLIVSSHEESGKLAVEMILPLLETSREALRRKNGAAVFEKSTSLLEIILKHKKGVVKEKKALKLFEKMVTVSSRFVNPVLKDKVGKIASFLCATFFKPDKEGKPSKLIQKLEELLVSYMTQNNNQILSEVVLMPLQSYPQKLVTFVEKLIEFAFKVEIRIFRRTEALSCALTFMKKDIVQESSAEDKKFWKHVAKTLGSYIHEYISKLTADELKPRFFAFVIRLLGCFVTVCSPSNRKVLLVLLDGDLKSLPEQFNSWNMSGKKKRQFNMNFQKICGRTGINAISHVHNLLKKAGSK